MLAARGARRMALGGTPTSRARDTTRTLDIVFDRGLHLPSLGLWMDSLRPRNGCWVSHAHADHTAGHQGFLATGATADLMALRYKRAAGRHVAYGQAVHAEGYRITLFPAGHCLGSSQMLVEVEATGLRVVYTGDFKLGPNPTAEPCTIVPCDVLVMESTFGEPHFAFPEAEEALESLRLFIDRCLSSGQVPVVLAYTLGKAQEALWHLLHMGYPVRYDQRIGQVVQVYERWGVSFPGDHAAFDPEQPSWPAGGVALMPPGARRGPFFRALHHPRTAMLTGWAVSGPEAAYRYRADALVPLSDHADFPALVRYVRESGAGRVYTVNGSPRLAEYLRKRGLAAQHLTAADGDAVQLSFPIEALQPA